jgi:antitoxin component of MazEF toxin-antitoxin module
MPHLAERRVLKIGNSLAVSLPKPWVDYYRVKQGDIVVLLSDGELKVKLKREQGKVK